MRMLRSRLARSRGFTLVELAIVVVVVGILAVVGVAIYRRQTATARTAEATQLTGGIRSAQEAYKAERGVYASVSNDTSSFYPAAKPGSFKTEWGGNCANCVDSEGWKKLDVHPAGPLMFGYATVSGVGGASLDGTSPPKGFDMAAPGGGGGGGGRSDLKATDPYYVTVAWGDTDADGKPCIVMSYSTSNQLVVQAAGE
jgi:prepilin-type N-terminal cleavage/methylation domain-containing protein